VTTPTASQRLDLWDCQFLQCNYGVVNLVPGSSTNTLHNVLFSACGAAVGAATNAITIEAEQVTADVGDFCLANATPDRMALTNSIILGNPPSATSTVSVQVALSPDGTNFTPSGTGITSTNTAMYYLAVNSPLHQAGSANISPRLQSELRNKTTYAPVALPPWMNLSGNMTLMPQAPRYTNGAPDIGYYYDALDYTMADLQLTGGTLNVLPGTAVGFRMDYGWAVTNWTYIGMDVCENANLNVQGMPNKPCVFVDVQQVQEQFAWPVRGNFVPDYWPQNDSDQPPILNFRFANLYADYVSYYQTPQYQFWSGISAYGYEWSADSAMLFTLQDCQLRGGQLDIGTPDNPDTGYGFLDYTNVLGNGAVTWNNNLFDGVSINLNPTYYSTYQVVNCDLQVTARNNLFRNATWLNIYGIPASAGNWTFEDNLFDKVQFYQDPTLPLDFDHNGYWPLAGEELLWAPSGYVNQLQPTATSDGSTEVILSNAPPYQAGAFGNYYLSQTNALYQAGSRSAADAGLTQYTTFTNQAKDEEDAPVNIGLHYVAATNSLPLDSDADGVPDYVEVEYGTDPNNPMTDGVTPDGLNTAYDDVDLSGNGLVGRIKKALGMTSADPNNPLSLKQIITGDEPQIATFEVPISYNMLTNIGEVKLLVDGSYVSWQGSYAGTNGDCTIQWNTMYNSPGNRLLQAILNLNGIKLFEDTPSQNIRSAQGLAAVFDSTNAMQFDDTYLEFDDNGANLYAKTPACSNASYTIELQTTNGQHIKTITNSTTSGVISENWDLMDDSGNAVAYDNVDAVFNVNLQDRGASKGKQRISKSDGVIDGNFTIACAYNNATIANHQMRDCVQHGVVDPLTSVSETGGTGSLNPYHSTFDDYSWSGGKGYPGLLSSSNDVARLISNLTNLVTRNFFMLAHGSVTDIGDGANPPQVELDKNSLASALGNGYTLTSKTIERKHAYRFVFLYGCHTADLPEWSDTFGIRETVSVSQANKGLAQAFVGWRNSPRAPVSDDEWNNFTISLQMFCNSWMSGANLMQCQSYASSASLGWPFTKQFAKGDINPNNFKLITYGYPLLKRKGFSQ